MVRGLILAGGKSSRMTIDKSTISYYGKPHREYLFEMLSKFCDHVHLSCESNDRAPLSLHPIADKFNIESPLNGILSAFEEHPTSAWLAVAVDMPLVNEETIHHLMKARDTQRMATCFFDSDGTLPEPLLTIWEPRAYQHLVQFYKNNEISPRKFLQQHDVWIVPVPDPKVLMNVNSPSEYETIQREINKLK